MLIGTWLQDEKLKEVGAWNYLQMMEGLEAFHQALFTRMLGYPVDEVNAMAASIRKEFKVPKIHYIYHFQLYVLSRGRIFDEWRCRHYVYGRKSEQSAKGTLTT